MIEKKPLIEDTRWHLDKKINLALVLAIILQTAAISGWAASTATRLNAVEQKIEATSPQAEKIIRLEEQLKTVVQGIQDIKQQISLLMRAPDTSVRPR